MAGFFVFINIFQIVVAWAREEVVDGSMRDPNGAIFISGHRGIVAESGAKGELLTTAFGATGNVVSVRIQVEATTFIQLEIGFGTTNDLFAVFGTVAAEGAFILLGYRSYFFGRIKPSQYCFNFFSDC